MRVLRFLLFGLVGAFLGAGLALAYLAYAFTRNLPDLSAFERLRLTSTSALYARDGSLLALLASVEEGRAIHRSLVRLSEVSPAAVAAIVASEDRRFFQHYGLDPVRLLGALFAVLKGDLQGGSTITTQVIKNTLLKELAQERTLERKFKEWALALELERRYTKEEILEMYLNVVPWGGNAVGIQGAAEAYFGKKPSELSLAEGAYLAALIPAPNARYFDLEGTRRRMGRLLDQMVQEGWISPRLRDEAWRTPLVPRGWEARYDEEGNLLSAQLKDPSARILPEVQVNQAPHVVYEVRSWLEARFGREKVYGEGGLRVYTTLDPAMQAAAERAARSARLPEGAELALVGLDPETGAVLALVGGVRKEKDEYNRAFRALRNPGSAVKPFVYATAFENGFTQASLVPDRPLEFPDPSQKGGVWRPKNFSGTFLDREITIRYALDLSLNLPAVYTANAIGVEKVAQKLSQAGFAVKYPTLAIAIGGASITPAELAGAYAAFINGGYKVRPYLVERVEDARGQVLYQARPERVRLFDPLVAYQGWDLLKGYVYDLGEKGLAKGARVPGRVVGGKTGTTNEARDLWFAGVTRGLSAVVWVGRDDNRPLRMGGREPSSSVVNPPIWRAFVEEALRGRPGGDFSPPGGLVAVRVDLLSGAPSPSGVPVYVPRGKEPEAPLPAPAETVTLALDRRTNCLAGPDTPPEEVVWLEVPKEEEGKYRCP
ncbi:transglycosylase domain-containing protein [Thermus filiformis]|uniref:peptidoglycan glycosyltransferase n=1 Tax=Thermus filiformis TaxID=276 RepID=A0A0D6XAK0_THEFI|nr:transglycosylase domain-containing protein [Thermus filiformis]KIX84371.1 penicillin-binding protein [Thermus filiformis]